MAESSLFDRRLLNMLVMQKELEERFCCREKKEEAIEAVPDRQMI